MSTGDRAARGNDGAGSMDTLARKIMDLDPAILECNISNDPDGAALANVYKSSLRGVLGPYSHTGGGMGPTWGGVAVNILRRLDAERSPLNYIIISREKYDAVLCPAKVQDRSIIIGVLMEKNTNAARVYEALKSCLSGM